MMLYVGNEDYKLHTEQADNSTPFELRNFDGMCKTYIEGHRYIPDGKSWMRDDGKIFTGPMCSPWKSHSELAAAQAQYEADLAAAAAAYQEGVDSAYDT